MTEWLTGRLGDFIELKRGYDLPQSQRVEGKFPIISSSGVTGTHNQARVEPPGVVTGRYGTLGLVFFVTKPFWPLNTSLYVKDFKGNDERFVALLLQSMNLAQHDGAAAVPGLNRNQLHDINVVVPALRCQKMVSAVAELLDDLIENNRRRIELLEEIARSIYREWFVHFRFPGYETATFFDSPLGPIPEGWEVLPLGQVADLKRPSLQPHKYPFELFTHYSIPAFDSGQRPQLELGETIKSGKYHLERPAILVSKLNPRIERTWFVEPDDSYRSVTSTEFLIFEPSDRCTLEYLYSALRSEAFQSQLQSLTGGTSTSHQRAKPGDVLNETVVLPCASLVMAFTTAVATGLRKSRVLREQNYRLELMRDLLLPKLVTGQIDVSQLDLGDLLKESVG